MWHSTECSFTTIKFTEDQILIKLKANYDADKIKTPNYDFFQALSDVLDFKDPKLSQKSSIPLDSPIP